MKLSARFSNAKHQKYVIALAIVCGMLTVLPGCHIPDLRPAQPTPGLPESYNGESNPENSARLGFQDFYNDPMLIGLVQQGLDNNRELRALNEEVQVAANEVLARSGAYLPFLSAGAGASLAKPSFYTPEGVLEKQLEYVPGKHFPDPLPNYMFGLDLFWQLDIWRALRNARDAAGQRYISASERRNFFVTRLVADIAENYYRLMSLDQRILTLNEIIKLQESSVKVSQALLDAGIGNGLAVRRFQADVRKNQSVKYLIEQEIVETENRVNYLANRFPGPVERSSAGFFDITIHALNVGLPAQLLQNRPDIRQAERELIAAGLDIKVARAQFFPALTLSAGVGYEAFSPKYLFITPESLVYNVAGNLVAPLINRRAIRASYLSANARQLQAVYNYQRIVLNAYTEVVNRLSMVQKYSKSIEVRKQQLDSLVAAVEAATKLFQAGAVIGGDKATYGDVLFAQRDLLDARTELIDTKRQQLSAIVNTYQALGGGDVSATSTNEPPLSPP